MITLSKMNRDEKSASTFKPQLTSLVDVMTILLVFLIQSFSAEGNLITPSSDLKLPDSRSTENIRLINSIKITRESICTDDKIITSMDAVVKSDSLMIPELFRVLSMEMKYSGKSELMIESDRNTPFEIVKKVMYTCSQAGKTDFTILVQRKE
ncbi:MAG TPA: biopolymer transporter ExbD [Chitinispirillaceae bacterium]|nr:biopolymer transporter ExbD [Chitinispirillaceae bacterium]